jgi:hypothetical protein
LFHVVVNAADATRTAAGTVLLDVPGVLPTVTPGCSTRSISAVPTWSPWRAESTAMK